MTQRRLFCTRARREKMEKMMNSRFRNQLWFVVFALFIFWYLLLYVHDWSSLRGLASLAHNHANSIESQQSNHVDVTTTNPNQIISPNSNVTADHERESMNEKTVDDKQADTFPPNLRNGREQINDKSEADSCSGRYIYVHDIPSRFNYDLLEQCQTLNKWTNMCQYMMNMGLGPPLPNTGWFATDQFSLEVIFHNRMKQYECLTNDSSKASAIFVPYYAGLEVARYLWGSNMSMRDSGSLGVVKWLREKPEWKSMWGRDHFLVAGRITWDFRRVMDNDSAWGNKLMLLPESKNMTVLTIESSPWNSNDFGIPYPTYFHPWSDKEVFQWQNRLRRQRRRFLFSFAGAPRPNIEESIRNDIIEQCQASRRKCKLLNCTNVANKCRKPVYVMKMFQSSVFCLQPPGDSFTRRSTFDTILAGCIPVFFHPASAYVQYLWHLPKNFDKYSVFIAEDEVKNKTISIERALLDIPKRKVLAMREEVIKLIPKVIYADPRSRLETLEDAFDVTLKGVLDRIETLRRDIREGRNSSLNIDEENSWKYNFFGEVVNHEWDRFFLRTDKIKYW
uniref:Putative xyloglucan galactosyltransferase KATAMARI1-like n=1 Tax=Davidia involucrata TaxID=16924 RepID=A0A5B7AK76_DAVIN